MLFLMKFGFSFDCFSKMTFKEGLFRFPNASSINFSWTEEDLYVTGLFKMLSILKSKEFFKDMFL